ncbi:hypothetical protein O7626_05450 [Micromonospora sp. WMMD1102]|uniref:hypothetical protein n=1 Tax=Micromonospora sp. WMMD1102 TaxID=3016105 RepID=UPI002415183C|nr:hypothetical protein [Micromonospora sp. WMMD1102]MDG4785384.1 hypothetical protein [Micromonospora sp. WMMD1102]
MRRAVTRRTATVLLAVLCLGACTSGPGGKKPDPEPPVAYQGNDAYPMPDTPFTRKGSVITASCLLGGRYAAVAVEAWDPDNWKRFDERLFAIPTDAAFSNVPGVEAVSSPLVDLCRQQGSETSSPYRADSLEHLVPRIRSLFDLGYTRMAVVLRDPGGKGTYAGFVQHDDGQDEIVRLDDATSDDEQNAVMSPDGGSVWFTYTTRSGERRIGSRAVEGDHRLSDEGPAAGHGLALTVSGKPPRAVQADMVRFSPNSRRLTASVPKVFGNVFDVPDSSGSLTATSARNATLASDCLGVVGWIDDSLLLCRASSGSFQAVDAQSGRTVGAPIDVVGPDRWTVAQGMLVSTDGTRFVVAVHPPNDRYGEPGQQPDFRVVSTAPGGRTIPIPGAGLTSDMVFLEWR